MLLDWVSPWWQAACLPKRWDVCGVSVPSLSVWHTFALENLGNGYLCGGRGDMDDAACLLLIASGDMAEGRKLVDVSRPLYRQRQQHSMFRRLSKLEPADVAAACGEYAETCMREARRWKKKDGGGVVAGAPYQFHVVHALCAGYQMGLDDAWNTSYAYARMLYDARAEANGNASIATIAAEALADENTANQAGE